MKLYNLKAISAVCLLCLSLFTSCLNDLNTLPLDKNESINENVYRTPEGYIGMIAKCYASLIQTGQKGGDGGDGDVAGIDEGYSGYTRALFYLQEATTDEIAFHSGSGHGTFALLFLNWDASTKVISYSYYRLYMAINYCNEFLREATDEKLHDRGVFDALKDEMPYYRAEARFIRAYCYTMLCDLYGSAPFVDETSSVGDIPAQVSREALYNYAVSELEELKDILKRPKANEYGRVDRVSAWFLLSRIYLNAETWVGKNEYTKAYQYAKKVIAEGNYPLASDYRHIFLADNNTCPEIIWSLPQDADNAQSSAGTNFLLKALMNGAMGNYMKMGVSGTWGNARVKTALVDKFAEEDQSFDENDTWGDNKMDKRAQFFTIGHTKETWVDGKDFQKDFNNGYACIKWRNVTKDRNELVEGGTKYSSIDYPMFRTADAYLMAAEAILRGSTEGTQTEALGYVNEVRERAYMSGKYGDNAVSGKITAAELNLDFILDERARELQMELVRRTDLIRFGKFTKGYDWDWKGSDSGAAGTYEGKDVDNKYNLFPIPQDEFTTNPNLTQNPDYK